MLSAAETQGEMSEGQRCTISSKTVNKFQYGIQCKSQNAKVKDGVTNWGSALLVKMKSVGSPLVVERSRNTRGDVRRTEGYNLIQNCEQISVRFSG